MRHAEYRSWRRGPAPEYTIDAEFYRQRETYRYDPLGRRVLMRSENDCYSIDGLKPHCDISVVRRTVWAGNSELLEIQRPASGMPLLYLGDTVTTAMMECDTAILALPIRPSGVSGYGYNRALDPGTLFGTVAYLHGLGIDRPLSMTRVGFEYRDDTGGGDPHKRWSPFTIIPHWDARGAARSGTFANGAVRHVLDVPADDYHGEAVVPWTMDELATARFQQEIILQWHGTLLSGKRDGTGTYYRRNRQYDPSTARFTQEDPIGFAGGYNLYGYAGGDPINYHDPFGLCSSSPDSILVTVTVDCGGGNRSEKSVWVKEKQTVAEVAALVAAASRLTGGSAEFDPASVALMYQGVARSGGVYVLPATVDGFRVVTGGATSTGGGTGAVAFGRAVISAYLTGNLGARVGRFDVANIIGHEGAHLLNADENQAYALIWGFRP